MGHTKKCDAIDLIGLRETLLADYGGAEDCHMGIIKRKDLRRVGFRRRNYCCPSGSAMSWVLVLTRALMLTACTCKLTTTELLKAGQAAVEAF